MDGYGEKALNGAVATRTPARDIAHGDVLRRTQRPGDDGTELTQHGGGMDLTKGAKQCKYPWLFLILGGEIPKIYWKSHCYAM